MLIKSSVWRGAIEEAYRSLVDEWLESNKEPETVIEFIDLDSFDSKKIEKDGLDALGLNADFFDLFASEQALLIKNIQSWSAPDVKKLVTLLQKMDSPLVVAFVQAKDAAAVKAVSDVVEEDHDYILPKEGKELGKWVVDYYKRNDASISERDANKLVDFCGEDRNLLVAIIRTSLSGNVGGKVIDWDNVLSGLVTKMGFVAPYKLTGAIATGDTGKSIVTLTRVLNGGMAPLAILGMLRNRSKRYITALGHKSHQSYAKEVGGSPYAAKFEFEEAHTLGGSRVAKILDLINKTDNWLKGGITGLTPTAIMEMLVVDLSNQFRLAKKR